MSPFGQEPTYPTILDLSYFEPTLEKLWQSPFTACYSCLPLLWIYDEKYCKLDLLPKLKKKMQQDTFYPQIFEKICFEKGGLFRIYLPLYSFLGI